VRPVEPRLLIRLFRPMPLHEILLKDTAPSPWKLHTPFRLISLHVQCEPVVELLQSNLPSFIRAQSCIQSVQPLVAVDVVGARISALHSGEAFSHLPRHFLVHLSSLPFVWPLQVIQSSSVSLSTAVCLLAAEFVWWFSSGYTPPHLLCHPSLTKSSRLRPPL